MDRLFVPWKTKHGVSSLNLVVLTMMIGCGIVAAKPFLEKVDHLLPFPFRFALDLGQRLHFFADCSPRIWQEPSMHLDLHQNSQLTYQSENKHDSIKF